MGQKALFLYAFSFRDTVIEHKTDFASKKSTDENIQQQWCASESTRSNDIAIRVRHVRCTLFSRASTRPLFHMRVPVESTTNDDPRTWIGSPCLHNALVPTTRLVCNNSLKCLSGAPNKPLPQLSCMLSLCRSHADNDSNETYSGHVIYISIFDWLGCAYVTSTITYHASTNIY